MKKSHVAIIAMVATSITAIIGAAIAIKKYYDEKRRNVIDIPVIAITGVHPDDLPKKYISELLAENDMFNPIKIKKYKMDE